VSSAPPRADGLVTVRSSRRRRRTSRRCRTPTRPTRGTRRAARCPPGRRRGRAERARRSSPLAHDRIACERRLRRSGTDSIDADPVAPVLDRRGSRQAEHAVLRRRIRRRTGAADDRDRRRHVDDRATARPQQGRDLGAHRVEDAVEVRREHAPPVVDDDVGRRVSPAGPTPALLTATSSRPNASSAAATIARHASGSVTSAANAAPPTSPAIRRPPPSRSRRRARVRPPRQGRGRTRRRSRIRRR
jgi:hypothetical protein